MRPFNPITPKISVSIVLTVSLAFLESKLWEFVLELKNIPLLITVLFLPLFEDDSILRFFAKITS